MVGASGYGGGGGWIGQPVEIGGPVVLPAMAGQADGADVLICAPLVEGRGFDTILRQNCQRGGTGDEFGGHLGKRSGVRGQRSDRQMVHQNHGGSPRCIVGNHDVDHFRKLPAPALIAIVAFKFAVRHSVEVFQ